MPFYEYRCLKGHTFEVRQSMSDEPLTACEVCGAEASRVLFAPAIHFKGSGFHNTDYGSKRRGGGDDGGGASTSDTSSNWNGSAAVNCRNRSPNCPAPSPPVSGNTTANSSPP